MNEEINSKKSGDQSAAIALAMLVESGYAVSIPWGDNQRYDLVAERNGVFWRIQCKTGWMEKTGYGYFRCNTSNKSTSNGKIVRKHYRGQIECFLVWFPPHRIMYCLPVNEVPITGCSMTLAKAESYRFQGTLPPR